MTIQADAVDTSTAANEEASDATEAITVETLIEDVSIDGMCGVY